MGDNDRPRALPQIHINSDERPVSQSKQTRFRSSIVKMVLAVDLLNPTPAAEARKHKLKNLAPAPRSFFMDVKCPGCSTVLCQPTGGKARLTEGCSFRRK